MRARRPSSRSPPGSSGPTRQRARNRPHRLAPQEIPLYPTLTVRENLRLFADVAGARPIAVTELAEELRLSGSLDRPTGVLSGGQRRRTQAATALIGDPPLILLDEPTAGTDPDSRTALLTAVRTRARAGAVVVHTSYYLPELVALDATLAPAREGKIVARGTRDELTRDLPGELRITFEQPGELPEALRQRVQRVDGEVRISTTDATADLGALLAGGWMPTTLDVRKPDLDNLYRSLDVRHAGHGDPRAAQHEATAA